MGGDGLRVSFYWHHDCGWDEVRDYPFRPSPANVVMATSTREGSK